MSPMCQNPLMTAVGDPAIIVAGIVEPDDGDTQECSGPGSATTSVASTALNFRYENGRRYHGFREGNYFLPNDKREQSRLELVHQLYHILFNGQLHRAPLKRRPRRVLDIGTAVGTWAIEFADQHSSSEVLGIDLSPIQQQWAPPNCQFEIDDAESEWLYDKSRAFDYIHSRDLCGSIDDYDRLFAQAYKNLRVGGYLEMQSFEANFFSDDGTRERAVTASRWQELLVEASKKTGRELCVEHLWKEKMEKAGFQEVVEEVYKVPLAPWPKDPKLKELGRYQAAHMPEMAEAFTLALFSRVLGWTREELDILMTAVRNDFNDPHAHLYTRVRVVYGRKAGSKFRQYCRCRPSIYRRRWFSYGSGERESTESE